MKYLVHINNAPEHFPFEVSVKTLRNWRARGQYPELFVKFGGKVYVDTREIEGCIQAEKRKTVAELKRLGLY
jgi:hypothetical protein